MQTTLAATALLMGLAMGLMLLWQARQPVWLENSARKVWRAVRAVTGAANGGHNSKPQSAAPLLILQRQGGRRWEVGHQNRGPGAVCHLCLGAVDGADARHGTLVPEP